MIVDSTNPRIMADNIRELARNGGGGSGSSGVSHYKITSGAIEGTFAEVLADLTAGKLVCLDVYANNGICGTYFRNGIFGIEETSITALGFYMVYTNKVYEGILSSDGSFTVSKTYPLPTDYSTTEKNTGIKWIDGKEIFQKTLVIENFAITTTASPFKYGSFDINTLIPNIEYLWVDTEASHIIHDGNQRQFVYGEYQGDAGLFIYSIAARTSCTLYITVLYTKATTTTKKRKTTKGEN